MPLRTSFAFTTTLAIALLGAACATSARSDFATDPGLGEPDGAVGSSDFGDAASNPRTCEAAAARKSYVGCDYWPTVTANPVWSVFDFAVVVVNTGPTEADIRVTGPGGVQKQAKVAPNALTKIYLPWVTDLKGPEFTHNAGVRPMSASVLARKGAYHLTSTQPIVVYQFNALEYQPSGGPTDKVWTTCPATKPFACLSYSNDASLLLPSTAMTGTYRVSGHEGWAAMSSPGYVAVTATEDGTTVSVNVGAKGEIVSGNGVSAVGPGGVATLELDAGDVVELLGTPSSDMSGSLVKANKPVQVITGAPCVNNPSTVGACDHVEESVFPAETLGQDYFVARPTGPRGEAVGHSVRLYGNFDGTSLTYTPSAPPGAPATLGAGETVDLGIVNSDFRVQGNHAFAVASFTLGSSMVDVDTAEADRKGDPSQSVAIAVQQYRSSYVFLAPDDYDMSFVDVIAPTGAEIKLDGVLTSASRAPVGASGFEILRLPLDAGKSGTHQLTATGPVGIQVMGYGSQTSYQYPGGSDFAAIAPPPLK
jgi:hypothetical protein